jgi:hypothetical protein
MINLPSQLNPEFIGYDAVLCTLSVLRSATDPSFSNTLSCVTALSVARPYTVPSPSRPRDVFPVRYERHLHIKK